MLFCPPRALGRFCEGASSPVARSEALGEHSELRFRRTSSEISTAAPMAVPSAGQSLAHTSSLDGVFQALRGGGSFCNTHFVTEKQRPQGTPCHFQGRKIKIRVRGRAGTRRRVLDSGGGKGPFRNI